MPKCQQIKRRHRKICSGDMDTEILIQNRAITPPVFGNPNFGEDFTNNDTFWASVETVDGKTFFDGVNTEFDITHHFYIEFDSTVTTQSWVVLNGQRIKILKTENLEERDEFLKLICTTRGDSAKEATKA